MTFATPNHAARAMSIAGAAIGAGEQTPPFLIADVRAVIDLAALLRVWHFAHGQQTDVHRGGVVWMDPGEGGPNWTVPVLTSRAMHRADIARIIRDLQMQFDLEE
ncbi:hypothetical protein [Variovorax arabinosiphilus]|uniref:hypothetical protein n=1 Tax=Variovorax arabinosiphilus TaxID=3053498 RepID=UPI002576EC3A|nr:MULTISPECIES: hypothetical protein [unclassified Variovorax]MDM0118429.1 hypothetical protein [Variovorax sp. J2L1-78]MDM0128854.1 hypothetical protein [Variovorax sp. J2L1-63]MDM0233360.1 hypothetical protein [Variovorax sp. J2R1-6]